LVEEGVTPLVEVRAGPEVSQEVPVLLVVVGVGVLERHRVYYRM
jgi:hypothetical protein